MLAAILQKAGYKTGLYTSPHLRDFRERIRINVEMIAEMEVIQFVEAHQQYIEKLEPSFFEVTVALAFEYFSANQVEVAIIEVGLGGRLDSTNMIHPELCVISNIGYDHMNILGNSLNEIAFEKAGIIKHNVPVIISQRQDEVEDIFINKAFEMNSGLTFASDEWDIFRSQTQNNSSGFLNLEIRQKTNIETPFFSFDSIELDLTGSYQLKNLAGVLSAVKHLRLMGYQIDDQDVLFALRQVKKLTGLMGRWHILKYDPLIICDTGHNEDGIREVMKNINLTPHKDLHMVIVMVKDKDISKILSLLPQKAFYYFCEPTIPRAKPAKHLQLEAAKFGLNGAFYPTVQAAFHEAKKNAGNNDLIFIGGSTFVVAEII